MKQYFRMDMPNTLAKSESEVEEQKALGKIGVIRNKMLGEFNEDGVYVITDAMRKQLLTMHKYLVERYNTQCLIESEYIFGKRFYFSLKVEDNVVTFALLEKMRYGTNLEHKSPYCNIHTTILDQINFDKLPDVLEETLFKRYNISIADQPLSTKLEDMSPEEVERYFELIDRKMQLELLNKDLDEKNAILERAEQDYYVAQIQALKKCGAYGKQVIDEMEHTLITVRPFLDPNRKGYYKALNQIISTITYSNRTEENKKEVAEFEQKIEKPRKNYAQVIITHSPDVRPTLHGADERKQTVEQIVRTYLKKQTESTTTTKSNSKIDEMVANTPRMMGEMVRSRVVSAPAQAGAKTQTTQGRTKSGVATAPKGKANTSGATTAVVGAGVAVAGAKIATAGAKTMTDTAKVVASKPASAVAKSSQPAKAQPAQKSNEKKDIAPKKSAEPKAETKVTTKPIETKPFGNETHKTEVEVEKTSVVNEPRQSTRDYDYTTPTNNIGANTTAPKKQKKSLFEKAIEGSAPVKTSAVTELSIPSFNTAKNEKSNINVNSKNDLTLPKAELGADSKKGAVIEEPTNVR